MSLYRRLILLRQLSSSSSSSSILSAAIEDHHHPRQNHQNQQYRLLAFSSAEEAAAERRRRKRRLRIEPPPHALRRHPLPPSPTALRLPDSTSSLVGHRLSLHNRIQTMIRTDRVDEALSNLRSSMFSNCRPTVFTCNAVAGALLRSVRLADVQPLFKFYTQAGVIPNVVSYNILINSLCDDRRVDAALEVYQTILKEAPFSPSPVTYRHLTKGLVDADRLSDAVDLLREMLNRGHGADSMVYGNIIGGFFDKDDIPRALEFFEELRDRCLVYDGVVHVTIMDKYFARGMEKEAMESYNSYLEKKFTVHPPTGHALLECLRRHDKLAEAEDLFTTMLLAHKPPSFIGINSETFGIMINFYCDRGDFESARMVLERKGPKPVVLDANVYNALLKRFWEKKMVVEAEEVFAMLSERRVSPNVASYELMVDGYLGEERAEDAIDQFDKLLGDSGLKPGLKFYGRFLTALFGGGMIEMAEGFFKRMKEKELNADVRIYEIMLNGLMEKEGKLEEVRELLEEMLNNGVAVSPEMKEKAGDLFKKEGKEEEFAKLFEPRAPNRFPRPPPPPPRSSDNANWLPPQNGRSNWSTPSSSPPLARTGANWPSSLSPPSQNGGAAANWVTSSSSESHNGGVGHANSMSSSPPQGDRAGGETSSSGTNWNASSWSQNNGIGWSNAPSPASQNVNSDWTNPLSPQSQSVYGADTSPASSLAAPPHSGTTTNWHASTPPHSVSSNWATHQNSGVSWEPSAASSAYQTGVANWNSNSAPPSQQAQSRWDYPPPPSIESGGGGYPPQSHQMSGNSPHTQPRWTQQPHPASQAGGNSWNAPPPQTSYSWNYQPTPGNSNWNSPPESSRNWTQPSPSPSPSQSEQQQMKSWTTAPDSEQVSTHWSPLPPHEKV